MRALATYPRCGSCQRPMALGQKGVHFMCDPHSTVGKACTCRPGCSKDNYGDQGTCDPDCQVCHIPGAKLSKQTQPKGATV